jgi:hypothetical protein
MLTIFTFVAADTGLVLALCSVLGGASAVLAGGLGAGLLAALALAAWRWPHHFTFIPVVWAIVMLIGGALLCAVAPDERRAILTQGLLTLLEVSIVTAIALLMSSFSTPFLSALMTFGLWIVGRSSDSLAKFPKKFFGPDVAELFKLLGKLVPNLHVYVPARPFLTGEAAGVDRLEYLLLATGTAIGWSIGLLAVASFVFKRRDFL